MSLPTAREVLVAKGLASPGRGRFSRDAVAFLATLTEGVDYAAVVKPVPAAPKPKPVVSSAPAPVVSVAKPSDYDPKAVRKWAEAEGLIEKGKRGRIPAPVIARYLATDAGVVAQRAKPVVQQTPVRSQNKGFAVDRGKVLTFDICGNRSCSMPVRFCKCATGPIAPTYLDTVGGKPLLMVKPLV